jgi:acyl transferase domain-containing protein/NADPH:quinone reductase-like Zn-dependent oxidoreductase/acyl carrier protein
LLEPKDKVAIVGMAFRLPGGIRDEDGLWDLLVRGGNAVGEIGPDRWATAALSHPTRGEPGRSVTFAAGVIEGIQEFDAAFFGISPREARLMDPQQRLVLELAWEALENGGQVPSALAGTDCAVYMGVSAADFMMRAVDDLSGVDAHTMTGSVPSIIANRISYLLDLRGPSLVVDTACSSSLVALHQAVQAVRRGEAGCALVGGVNVLLHPFPFVGFSKASMLSPGGRCRTFDARGDGYVRAEGGVALFIKPLERALRDGDPIQAVILATGVNSDGRNEGMTLPRPETQAELLRKVIREAGVDPARISYVETHGTGTAAGDPVETAALGMAFGEGRGPGNPLHIGSVKTNLGHLEPASGLAGLVKSVVALKRRTLPPSVRPEVPDPRLALEEWGLRVVTEPMPLPDSPGPAIVGVSSFGFGGTNAHVTLEEAPAVEPQRIAAPPAPPLILSAQTEPALRALAARYAERLAGADADDYYRVAFNAAFRRQPLDEGVVVRGPGPTDIVAALRAMAAGEDGPDLVRTARLGSRVPVAFVFSGNGAQWAGMGKRLLASEPLFLQAVREVDRLAAAHTDISILRELGRDPGDDRLHLTEVAQPALLAMQVGITTLLRERGLDPDAVTGHSVGEIAAAWAAGCLTLEQAVQVVVERSAAQAQTAGAGRMAAVGRSAAEVLDMLAQAGLEGTVEVAVLNSPRDVTVSGALEALQALEEQAAKSGAYYRLLDLDYAFHSRHMDGQRNRILERLAHLRPSESRIPFVSTVTGDAVPGVRLGADYWWENIRHPVLFHSAVDHLLDRGTGVFVEIGPHAIMQRYLGACLRERRARGAAVPTLQRGDDGPERITEALWRVHLLGARVRMDRHFPIRVPPTPLPTYPWQRERYWPEPTNEAGGVLHRNRVHPLLGWPVGDQGAAWENHLDLRLEAWLGDHRVGGRVLFPATGYVEMALAASAQRRPGSLRHDLEDLEIRVPMPLQADRARTVRLDLDPDDGSFRISSRERLSEEPWVTHAVGRLCEPGGGEGGGEEGPQVMGAPPPAGLADGARVSGADRHYELARGLGLDYGPAFQAFREAWREGETRVVARLERPGTLEGGGEGLLLHPALLDAAFQSVLHLVAVDQAAGDDNVLIPVRVGRLVAHAPGGEPSWCRVTLSGRTRRSVLMDVEVFGQDGSLLASVDGCRLRATPRPGDQVAELQVWGWTTEVRPRGPEEPSPAPHPEEMAEAVRRAFPTGPRQRQRTSRHAEVLPLLEAVLGIFAYDAARAIDGGTGKVTIPPALARHPLGAWLLRVLREDGFLEESAGALRLIPPDPSPPDASRLWTAILGDNPEYLPDLSLLGRLGRQFPRILAGQAPPEELSALLAEDGLWGRYVAASPVVSHLREAVAAALAGRASSWPAHRRLRILEVGGESLLPVLIAALPEGRFDVTHVFDAPSPPETLRTLGEALPGLQLVPSTPGFPLPGEVLEGGGYDVVVVHPRPWFAPLVSRELQELGGLLAAGGLLIALHRVPDRWTALVQALGEGPRVDVAPGSWARLLSDAGLEDPQLVVEPESGPIPSGCFATLARQPRRPSPADSPDRPRERWLVVSPAHRHAASGNGDSSPWGTALSRALRDRGQAVVEAEAGTRFERLGEDRYTFDATDPAGSAGLIEAVHADGAELLHVVLTPPHGGAAEGEPSPEDPLDAAARRVIPAFHLVRSLEERQARTGESRPHLWILTRGAAFFADPRRVLPSAPSEAPVWGFGRVLMNEHPGFRCTLVDLQDDAPRGAVIHRVLQEFLDPDGEEEIVLAPEGRRLVSRLRPAPLHPESMLSQSDAGLEVTRPGQLRGLAWKARSCREPGDHEVEIETRAVGLNFRDVMYALGVLPEEALEGGFAGASLGLEVSGVITKAGGAVQDLIPGDEVVAFTSGGFGGRLLTPASAVARKPQEWSFAAAATVPTAFLTSWYALHSLARLQPGERVLIHGAAGGVGLAAVQVARHLGAEIFATAGSEEKRDVLRLLGVEHVLDSRRLAFAEEILRLTDGSGVDVVLNSLAGEAARRSLRVLRPFGRFLELGKRDFYENARLGLRPFKDNITYHGIDADQLMLHRPELAQAILREVMELLSAGTFRPLPHRVFPASQVVSAFRYMQQSRQIGKVVVEMGGEPVQAVPARRAGLRFREDRTYLVAGGIGGLGLRTARWLAEHGAGHLLLVSRSGAASPTATEATAAIEAAGARAYIRACDIEDRQAVSRVARECGRELPPLAGVVHSAMLLDDGVITNLDAGRILRVMAPKVRGAWNLHLETRSQPLEHFIMFSSASTCIGNPGQANYVAANLYVEALAALRRAEGLPATCVGWGAIRDTGYFTRHESVLDALRARAGGTNLRADDALRVLETLLDSGASGVAVSDFEWSALSRFLPSSGSARFAPLAHLTGEAGVGLAGGQGLRVLLAEATPEEARGILVRLITDEVARVLYLAPDAIAPDRLLQDLGMDSLTAMELVVSLEARLQMTLPAMALGHRSIDHMVDVLQSALAAGNGSAPSSGDLNGTDPLRDALKQAAWAHGVPHDEDRVSALIEEITLGGGPSARSP